MMVSFNGWLNLVSCTELAGIDNRAGDARLSTGMQAL
jgi:hypothetical protein